MGWRNNRRIRAGYYPAPRAYAEEVPSVEQLEKLLPLAKTNWEKSFLTSILEQVKRKPSLSVAQVETFKKLEVSLTKGAEDNTAFAKVFTEEQREKYRVACEYYSTTVYYGSAIREYREQVALGTFSSFVPSAKSFVALVENKYFAKIWAAFRAVPRFHCGDLVVAKKYLVKGINRVTNYNAYNDIALILKADPQTPLSPAVGSKLYLVRSLASGKELLVEERHLKVLKREK